MGNSIAKLKTEEALLKDLQKAKKPTAEEIKEQRVSFVYGAMNSESAITREQVRKQLQHA